MKARDLFTGLAGWILVAIVVVGIMLALGHMVENLKGAIQ
jgi:hypothetical protein